MGTRIIDRTLREISAELAATARKLEALSRRPERARYIVYKIEEIREKADILAALARNEHQARRMREAYIPTGQFGEPAWDILLDLFAHTILNTEIQMTSAQIAAHCPPTTALRYIETLESEGMIVRRKSESDGRVTYLKLTDAAIVSVGSYLINSAGLGEDG